MIFSGSLEGSNTDVTQTSAACGLHVDGAFYHVILRGNHRDQIFFQPADRDRFAMLVADNIERFRMRVHAYCWMSNHVHLLMQVADIPLGRVMMRIAGNYAREMQRFRPTTGHFFERRYRAILVDADSYLIELIRYIHLNPVRAGMVDTPDAYQWSGHRAYLGLTTTPWLTTDFSLSLFNREQSVARDAYRQFVLAGIGIATDQELISGRPDDQRILGDDVFLARLTTTRRPRRILSLQGLIGIICRVHATDPETVLASGRQRHPAKLRAVILHHALHLRIATLSDIARHFKRSASTLSESLDLYRRIEPALFDNPIDFDSH